MWFSVTCALVVLLVGFAGAVIREACVELVCRIGDIRLWRVVSARLEDASVAVALDTLEDLETAPVWLPSSALV